MSRYIRFEQSRPDELAEIVRTCPVVYWPLGLIEHHGWHLPVGFDGIKAQRICELIADDVGGVILPVMWWGGGGGHGEFNWTLYQSEDAAEEIFRTTLLKLISFGFRVFVLMAGHYPWRTILNAVVPPLREQHSDILFIAGTEMEIAGTSRLPGDHAAREETSYGLSLLPELVDMDAMKSGRSSDIWPNEGAPADHDRIDILDYDPDSPLFAQAGEDARLATSERGGAHVSILVENVTKKIKKFL